MNSAIHNKYAPYWAILFIILLVTGLSTQWHKAGGFCNGYVLDMAGPAWTYILFRGLFTKYADNKWTRFFKPKMTFISILTVAYSIELLQYFEVYESTYDVADLLAYLSILLPVFIIDQRLVKGESEIH
jgi:hypothetical protein